MLQDYLHSPKALFMVEVSDQICGRRLAEPETLALALGGNFQVGSEKHETTPRNPPRNGSGGGYIEGDRSSVAGWIPNSSKTPEEFL